MKTILYLRVSTEEQAKQGVSLEVQREKIEAYCRLYDLTVSEVIVDDGVSAKSLRRPGLSKALRQLRNGHAEGLVVYKLDRLSRSVKDWNTLIEDYFGERAGKQLFSVSDQIDTRTAAGRLVLNVLMSVYQWEREAIGERTADGLDHKIRKGELVGAVPYGFDVRYETRAVDGMEKQVGVLVEIPAEQKVLGQIKLRRDQGHSFRAIAEWLNDKGVPTKRGKGAWIHTAVRRIVKRRAG
jgi:DNA invertase Pin-like site-specific DNA recombinase